MQLSGGTSENFLIAYGGQDIVIKNAKLHVMTRSAMRQPSADPTSVDGF